jgi:hypothetical protein
LGQSHFAPRMAHDVWRSRRDLRLPPEWLPRIVAQDVPVALTDHASLSAQARLRQHPALQGPAWAQG